MNALVTVSSGGPWYPDASAVPMPATLPPPALLPWAGLPRQDELPEPAWTGLTYMVWTALPQPYEVLGR